MLASVNHLIGSSATLRNPHALHTSTFHCILKYSYSLFFLRRVCVCMWVGGGGGGGRWGRVGWQMADLTQTTNKDLNWTINLWGVGVGGGGRRGWQMTDLTQTLTWIEPSTGWGGGGGRGGILRWVTVLTQAKNWTINFVGVGGGGGRQMTRPYRSMNLWTWISCVQLCMCVWGWRGGKGKGGQTGDKAYTSKDLNHQLCGSLKHVLHLLQHTV